MNQIDHRAYISKNETISYSEIDRTKVDLFEVIDETNVPRLLGVLAFVLKGDRSFSVILKRSDIVIDMSKMIMEPGSITIFSSGTTGIPTSSSISFDDLVARITSKIDEGEIVASGYDITKFSGLQALLACLRNSATYLDVGMQFSILEKNHFTRIVGTPSWCNYLVMHIGNSDFEKFKLVRSITLGGEAADDRTLRMLKSTFPSADINQIYASTEAGVLFNIKDRLPGLSLESALHFAAEKRVAWSDDLDELSEGDLTELIYFDRSSGRKILSGDIFQIRSGRLVFYGRDNDCVSIGGQNVSLVVLEALVNEHQCVRICRALAKKNSMMGHILLLEVELDLGVRLSEIKKDILHRIKDILGSRYLPASISEVHEIKLNSNGKVIR